MMVTQKQYITNILLSLVRLSLVVLWLPVAVEKLWDLNRFHSTLLRQPFPDWWADVLFWLLPVLELLAAVLIAWPKKPITTETSLRGMRQGSASRSNLLTAPEHMHWLGLWLSAILLFGFTLFILFGVLGWYEKRPCGCGSVIGGLSWEQHLWFNLGFLLLSILGIWLTWPNKIVTASKSAWPSHGAKQSDVTRRSPLLVNQDRNDDNKKHFPRKFALFRRGAVRVIEKIGET